MVFDLKIKVAEPVGATNWTAASIASALSQPESDLVLMYCYAKGIWDKLVSVYEESSIQRLSLLMTWFL